MKGIKKGKLVVISGPSGTGKGAICNQLVSKNKNISLSVSLTTRSPRKNEEDGREYHFITKEKFEEEIKNGGILEYANVYGIGNYYGTPKDKVFEQLDQGKDVILEIDVEGGKQVRNNYQETLLIFIIPPTKAELRKRIVGRGTEANDIIDKRLKEATREIEEALEYDYLIINDKIDNAVSQIEAILVAEKARIKEENFDKMKSFKEEE